MVLNKKKTQVTEDMESSLGNRWTKINLEKDITYSSSHNMVLLYKSFPLGSHGHIFWKTGDFLNICVWMKPGVPRQAFWDGHGHVLSMYRTLSSTKGNKSV